MKKLLIVVMLILLAAPAFAASPTAKGNFMVSLPCFSYWMGMGDLDESSELSFLIMGFEPEVQYFFMDNLAIGAKVGYRSEEDQGMETKTTSFGPVANYFIKIKADFLPYAGAGLLYETIDYEGAETTTTQLKVQGGAIYKVYKSLYAYGEVFLAYAKVSNGSDISGQKVGLAAGIKAFF